jgi:hypothetical protein
MAKRTAPSSFSAPPAKRFKQLDDDSGGSESGEIDTGDESYSGSDAASDYEG